MKALFETCEENLGHLIYIYILLDVNVHSRKIENVWSLMSVREWGQGA